MAIVAEPDFKDGFDANSAAQVARKWNVGGPSIVATPGRAGITDSQMVGEFASMRRTVTATNGGIMQFWFRTPNVLPASTTVICAFYNSLSGGRGTALQYTTGGVLQLINGQTLGIIASATDPLQSLVPATGYYIEFGELAHLTNGSADVVVNGAHITGLFGLTGKATSNASNQFDTVELVSTGTGSRFDDFYYRTAPSGYNNATDFLGDLVIETVYPDAISGDAGHNQGTPYGGATNGFDGIDEHMLQNDETDGVDLTAIGNKHYTSFGTLQGPPGSVISSIKSVQLNIMARRVTAGFSNTLQPGTVKGGAYGTDYLGTAQALADTFTDIRKAWAVRPDGSGSWIPADIATG